MVRLRSQGKQGTVPSIQINATPVKGKKRNFDEEEITAEVTLEEPEYKKSVPAVEEEDDDDGPMEEVSSAPPAMKSSADSDDDGPVEEVSNNAVTSRMPANYDLVTLSDELHGSKRNALLARREKRLRAKEAAEKAAREAAKAAELLDMETLAAAAGADNDSPAEDSEVDSEVDSEMDDFSDDDGDFDLDEFMTKRQVAAPSVQSKNLIVLGVDKKNGPQTKKITKSLEVTVLGRNSTGLGLLAEKKMTAESINLVAHRGAVIGKDGRAGEVERVAWSRFSAQRRPTAAKQFRVLTK